MPTLANLRDAIPAALPDELITVLARSAHTRIERIVSRGHASAPGAWYDQAEHELVLLVAGAASLEVAGQPPVTLGPGDWILLEAHVRHRVAWTAPDQDTIWLAVFFTD